MVTLNIGDAFQDVDIQEVDKHWIVAQIKQRLKDGENPCIRIIVTDPPVSMSFSTANCGRSQGGGGPLTVAQQKAAELWNGIFEKGKEVEPGMVISFLERIEKMVKR